MRKQVLGILRSYSIHHCLSSLICLGLFPQSALDHASSLLLKAMDLQSVWIWDGKFPFCSSISAQQSFRAQAATSVARSTAAPCRVSGGAPGYCLSCSNVTTGDRSGLEGINIGEDQLQLPSISSMTVPVRLDWEENVVVETRAGVNSAAAARLATPSHTSGPRGRASHTYSNRGGSSGTGCVVWRKAPTLSFCLGGSSAVCNLSSQQSRGASTGLWFLFRQLSIFHVTSSQTFNFLYRTRCTRA